MAEGSSERVPLVSDKQFEPIDLAGAEQRRKSRRRFCVTAVVVACLGVSLCLAIALPLTQKANSGEAAPSASKLMLMMQTPTPDGQNRTSVTTSKSTSSINSTSSANSTSPTTVTTARPPPTYPTRPTLPPWPTPPTFPPWPTPPTLPPWPTLFPRSTSTAVPATTNDDRSTSASGNSTGDHLTTTTKMTTTPTSAQTTTASWLLPSCPLVPQNRRGQVDMKFVNGSVWFELGRVQTYNAPAYVEQVSCATMELHMGPEPATEAVMDLGWEEGTVYRRYRRYISIKLKRNDASSENWIETFNTTGTDRDRGQISFLSLINDYLLVYECFPYATWIPKPGYVIRVYSTSPQPDASRLDEALLLAADVWGLNPASMYPRRTRQYLCDLNVGYA